MISLGVKELEILITMRNPMKIDEFGEFSDKLASALATYTITSSAEAANIRGLNHSFAEIIFSFS